MYHGEHTYEACELVEMKSMEKLSHYLESHRPPRQTRPLWPRTRWCVHQDAHLLPSWPDNRPVVTPESPPIAQMHTRILARNLCYSTPLHNIAHTPISVLFSRLTQLCWNDTTRTNMGHHHHHGSPHPNIQTNNIHFVVTTTPTRDAFWKPHLD